MIFYSNSHPKKKDKAIGEKLNFDTLDQMRRFLTYHYSEIVNGTEYDAIQLTGAALHSNIFELEGVAISTADYSYYFIAYASIGSLLIFNVDEILSDTVVVELAKTKGVTIEGIPPVVSAASDEDLYAFFRDFLKNKKTPKDLFLPILYVNVNCQSGEFEQNFVPAPAASLE